MSVCRNFADLASWADPQELLNWQASRVGPFDYDDDDDAVL